MKRAIALIHYSAPSVIGGVESVMNHHAQQMIHHGQTVRFIVGQGEVSQAGAELFTIPLLSSRHPRILICKRKLDQGEMPEDFDQLVDEIAASLRQALVGIDLIFAHNVCSLHKNLPLAVALRRVCGEPKAPKLVLWHHDFAWTSGRYQRELHAGFPWNQIREDWPEVAPEHVVVSDLRQKEFAELFQLPAEQATVIPSGVDFERFLKFEHRSKNIVNHLNLFASDPLLLLPMRVTRRKNIELAVRITAAMTQHFSRPTLVVTGPPGAHNPDNQAYLNELKELRSNMVGGDGLAGAKIHFLADLSQEFLPDDVISDLYRISDGVLITSREEGFGIPMVEAGLLGLPIFCNDIPPLRAIAGRHATYFDLETNPADIAQTVHDKLCFSAEYRLKREVRQRYAWEDIYHHSIVPLLK